VGGIAPERLVFFDESAVLTSMARRYGRSPRGQRAYAKEGPVRQLEAAERAQRRRLEGFLATMSVEAATDSATIAAFSSRYCCICPPTART
jgi:predicted ATPase